MPPNQKPPIASMTVGEWRSLFSSSATKDQPLSRQLEIGRRREEVLDQVLKHGTLSQERREKLQMALDAQQRINCSQQTRLSLGHEW